MKVSAVTEFIATSPGHDPLEQFDTEAPADQPYAARQDARILAA